MEFDQKEEVPYNVPEVKKTDKKQLAIYIVAGVITLSSLTFGYANYQATYFKDTEIKNLKAQLDDANTKLLRIEGLENQVKELEASLAAKIAVKAQPNKQTKISPKKDVKKVTLTKKVTKKTKTQSKTIKEKK